MHKHMLKQDMGMPVSFAGAVIVSIQLTLYVCHHSLF